MAEFQGIFYHPFLPSLLIIEGVDGIGSKVGRSGLGWDGEGWVGGWIGREVAKTTPSDTP